MSAHLVLHGAAETGQKLDGMRGALADAIVERHYMLRPELAARHGERGRHECHEGALHHLTYLAQAMAVGQQSLFREYVAWAKVMLAARGIPARDLADNLNITADVLRERLPAADAAAACRYVDAAIAELPEMLASLPSCFDPDKPLAHLARAYLAALLSCERQRASRMIMDATRDGTPVKDIYIHVFQRSQREIGRLWQQNQITVAQEHYCTAATQMIMSQLYPQIFAAPRIGRTFLGASVSGELHEIGIRIISDFFEMEGWDTVFLGASVPVPDLLKTIVERKPDLVGISVALTPHVGAVASTISAIRATPGCQHTKILVGGYPFLIAPDLWKEVNADGTSPDAQGAIELANQLVKSRGAG